MQIFSPQCAFTFYGWHHTPGWYGVAIQIEDYDRTTNTLLSSIPLQFLVFVPTTDASSCYDRPQLVGATPPDGSCYPVAYGSTWSAHIVASGSSAA